MRHDEHAYLQEIPGPSAERAASAREGLDAAAVRDLVHERRGMLESVAPFIRADLREAIRAKLAYEERLLGRLIERQASASAKKAERRGVLRSEHFVRRPLPPRRF